MNDPSPITHFEVYGRDPAALAGFYEKLLGWSVAKAEGVNYWRISPAPRGSDAIGGGITFRPDGIAGGWLCYARVASVDETIARALSFGGRVVRPKTAVPRTAWYAVIADPEDNGFGIWEPSAIAFPLPEPD